MMSTKRIHIGKARRRRALLTPALVLLILTAACLGRFRAVKAPMDADGVAQARLTRPGLSRIVFDRPEGSTLKTRLSIENAGPSRVERLALRGAGGEPYLECPLTAIGGPDEVAFGLLPGERLVCSAHGDPSKGLEILLGSLMWEKPAEPDRVRASLIRAYRANVDAEGRIVLEPDGAEAWIELLFDAPLEHTAASIAWASEPLGTTPAVWISVDPGAWGRMENPRSAANWSRPLELDRSVAGRRGFGVRLTWSGQKLTFTGLRVEREIQSPGLLTPWRPGLNEMKIAFESPAKPAPDLIVRIMDQP